MLPTICQLREPWFFVHSLLTERAGEEDCYSDDDFLRRSENIQIGVNLKTFYGLLCIFLKVVGTMFILKINFSIVPLMTFFAGICFISGEAHSYEKAKELRYKDYPVEVRAGDRIAFSGLRANIRVLPSTKVNLLTIRVKKSIAEKATSDDLTKFENLSFAVRRDGNSIYIETKGPEGKQAWSQWIKNSAPELSIDIESPGIPTELVAHSGTISLLNIKQPTTIQLVQGTIRTSATEGLLRIGMQNGSVAIEKHQGKLELDAFSVKLNLQELAGDLNLTNFSGDSNVSKIKGNIEVKSNTGLINISKSAGSLDFLAGRGPLLVANFDGPVRGQSDLGAVTIGLDADADVNIESNQGPVTVKLPSNSGALIRLQSEEGSLAAPEPVKQVGSAKARLVSGRLGGDGPKGNVSVKSKSGALKVRF